MFKPKNEPLGLGADALYFGYATGFKSFGSLRDREPVLTVRLRSVCPDEIRNQMVERSTEVVDDITQDSTQSAWETFLDPDPENILSRIRILLTSDLVRVFGMKGLKLGFQIHNVAFGPFNFQFGTGKTGRIKAAYRP
jgi:hypothetical protein